MSEYIIPKTRRHIVVTLRSSMTIAGDVFLQSSGRYGDRMEGPLDILNATEAFFPLLPDSGAAVLIAKEQVVAVSLDRADEEDDVRAQGTPRVNIEVRLIDGETFSGAVFLEVPKQYSRLLDFLNRYKHRFLALDTADGQLLLNRSMIESIRSLD